MAKAIVVMGDINVDMLMKQCGPAGPLPYELEVRVGGTAANTAVALAHLGLPVELLGTVGDGSYGRFLRRDLAAEGVGTAHIHINPGQASLLIVYAVSAAGDILFGRPGWPQDTTEIAMTLAVEAIDTTLLTSAAWLHCSGTNFLVESYRAGALYAMSIARDAGVPISLDLNIRSLEKSEAFWTALRQGIEMSDVVLGSASDDWPQLLPGLAPAEAARQVAAEQRICVVRMGAAGSLAVAPAAAVEVGVFPVQVQDSVGAGDSYNAGFITGRLEGRSLADSLWLGSAVAALTISRAGTRQAPTRTEVDVLLASRSA